MLASNGSLNLRRLTGQNNPNGKITGFPGEIYQRSDGSLWVKVTGKTTKTGWLQVQTIPASPVKRYVATITQTGTAAPVVVNVLQNSLGATITFGRTALGVYKAIASAAVFTAGKTVMTVNAVSSEAGIVSYGPTAPSTTELAFSTLIGSAAAEGNEIKAGSSIVIEVYP